MSRKAKVTKIFQWAAFGLFVLTLSFAVSGKAMAECAPYPKIAIWNELTHEFARRLVNQKYDGDWDAYLVNLERYERKLKGIHSKGLPARITWREKKLRVKGARLLSFLKLVNKRISITRCLADTTSIANFSTAAGGTDQSDTPDRPLAKKCAKMPQVAWWKFKSHAGVIGYVSNSFRNDWGTYIGKWNDRLAKLQDIKSRGKYAITSTGVKLGGRNLDSYISKMQKRISVVQCLAGKHAASGA